MLDSFYLPQVQKLPEAGGQCDVSHNWPRFLRRGEYSLLRGPGGGGVPQEGLVGALPQEGGQEESPVEGPHMEMTSHGCSKFLSMIIGWVYNLHGLLYLEYLRG